MIDGPRITRGTPQRQRTESEVVSSLLPQRPAYLQKLTKIAPLLNAGLFFQRFCENSAAKKTQLPSVQKLKAIFVQKLKVGAAFI